MVPRSSPWAGGKVTPPGTDERPELGELTFIDNTVDASTGTIKLKGTLANEQHRLWPGQFASVTVTTFAAAAEVDPGLVITSCANCGATMTDRKCKLVCSCGYFLSCSDYY